MMCLQGAATLSSTARLSTLLEHSGLSTRPISGDLEILACRASSSRPFSQRGKIRTAETFSRTSAHSAPCSTCRRRAVEFG